MTESEKNSIPKWLVFVVVLICVVIGVLTVKFGIVGTGASTAEEISAPKTKAPPTKRP